MGKAKTFGTMLDEVENLDLHKPIKIIFDKLMAETSLFSDECFDLAKSISIKLEASREPIF